MPARDLRGFLVALDAEGDLARIRLPVNPNGEIGAVAARAADLPPAQRHALLFDQVSGEGGTPSPFRVAANLYATHDRMALALNATSLDDIRSRFARLFDFNFPRGSMGMMTRLADFIDLARSLGTSTGMVRPPPVQKIVHRETVNALLLPAIRVSMRETHPSLTAALLIVKDANGMSHLRSVRAAVLDSHTLAVQLDPALSDDWTASEARPVALALGADPALLWSAAVPLPEGFDRGLLAAWLRGKAVPMASALSQPLEIPAEAEVVIEGR
ncbi:MAG: UbiD family decarboxylase [Anaerolineae bacterium]